MARNPSSDDFEIPSRDSSESSERLNVQSDIVRRLRIQLYVLFACVVMMLGWVVFSSQGTQLDVLSAMARIEREVGRMEATQEILERQVGGRLEQVEELARELRSSSADVAQIQRALDDGYADIARALVESERFRSLVAAEARSVPVGAVLAWPAAYDSMPVDLREMWKPCDGKSVPFSQDLWRALGGYYGNIAKGDTIRLPDYRGYFLRGVDDGAGRDPESARSVGSVQEDELARHSHAVTVMRRDSDLDDGVSWAMLNVGEKSPSTTAGDFDFSTASAGGSETRPVNVSVHWVIRVK